MNLFYLFVFFGFFLLLYVFPRSTEHNHVKDNLLSKLLGMQTFSKIKFEEFEDLISVADYKVYESKVEKNPTWYPLTMNVFVKILYKVNFLFLFILFFFHSMPFSYTYFYFSKENYRKRQILQQACTVRLLPRIVLRLLKFCAL